MSNNNLRTAKQQEILAELTARFDIDENRILFLNSRDENEPWIPADEMMSIARQHGGFKSISVTHDKFVKETLQVIYTAMVIDGNEKTFVRSGVATFGEAPNGVEIDADTLASGRALNAALRDAGFHPYKSGSIVNLEEARKDIKERRWNQELQGIEDEAALRVRDLRQIHALAQEKGLVVGDNKTGYRLWLSEKYNVKSAMALDAKGRAQMINALTNYRDDFADYTDEFSDEAMAA